MKVTFVALGAVPLLGEVPSLQGAIGIGVVALGMWLVQTDGAVRWGALLEPGAGYAYLALAATVVYSLVDKAAMQRLAEDAWSGPAPRAVVFYCLMCAGSAAIFLPLAATRLRRIP